VLSVGGVQTGAIAAMSDSEQPAEIAEATSEAPAEESQAAEEPAAEFAEPAAEARPKENQAADVPTESVAEPAEVSPCFLTVLFCLWNSRFRNLVLTAPCAGPAADEGTCACERCDGKSSR
jgi:hypothetical protein